MSADTKTALLDHAEQIARSRGFDGFSYADLATAVGIRKASIHYHFPTKALLAEALIDRYHENIMGICQEIDQAHNSGADRLMALINLYRNALNEGKTLCLCIAFTTSRESLSDGVINKIGEFRQMMIDWLKATFELGLEDQSIVNVDKPINEARSTLAILEGAHLNARSQENVSLFDQSLALLKDRL